MDSNCDKTVVYNNRKSSPQIISKIWLLLEESDYHKSDKQFIQLLMNKMFEKFNIKLIENKFNELIANAIQDKLIVEDIDTNGFRYKPNFDRSVFEASTHDWYCFECHDCKEQEVPIDCKTCFRTFHKNCIKVSSVSEEFECIYCEKLRTIDNSLRINTISSTHLNKLLSLLINNLEISFGKDFIYEKFSIEENERSKVLVFKPMDLITIKQNVINEKYTKVEEFENDFKHFIHNYMVLIVNDWNHKWVDISKFEKSLNHEISELKLCIDCYLYSSDNSFDDENNPYEWFIRVCEPPHELVFAKFGNYPFWPSKVIQIKNKGKSYDVRFFDPPNFSRAVLPIQKLRPIHYKDSLQLTEDEELELPLELLEKHRQKLCEKGLEFPQTVTKMEKSSDKKRAKSAQKESVEKRKRFECKPPKATKPEDSQTV